MPCGLGKYCVKNVQKDCPAGRYGIIANETSSLCSGKCTAGYYCPAGSTTPRRHRCGTVSNYCPEGSGVPLVAANGYYTTPENVAENVRQGRAECPVGHYCTNGEKRECPAGYYGSTVKLSSATCTGLCPEGYYCPAGTSDPTDHPCGGANNYCPAGSAQPIEVTPGYYSTPLDTSAETRVSQTKCEPGYYCQEGIRYDCGNIDRYCPEESTTYQNVSKAYYTTPISTNASNREGQTLCEQGYYCHHGTRSECGSISKYCPEGSYEPKQANEGYYTGPEGVNENLKYTQQLCEQGYYCTQGRKQECGEGYYCPSGSSRRIEVPDGYESQPTTVATTKRYEIQKCPAGFYCVNGGKNECGVNKYCPEGSSSPKDVPEGYIAGPEVAIETQKSLIVNCTEGYYCSGGAMMDCGVGFYCPAGSSDPIPVSDGYFVIPEGVNEMHGVSQSICPAGFYCVNGGKNECGVNKYCPEGSSSPKDVPEGYIAGPEVAIETQKSLIVNCTEGYYCSGGAMMDCGVGFYCPAGSSDPIPVPYGYISLPFDVSLFLRFAISICPLGSYCISGVRSLCPAGFFGDSYGLSSKNCSGLCLHGYLCPRGTVSPRSHDCGNSSVYCPTGSYVPTPVSPGYYSGPIYVDPRNRFQQWICPVGHFCIDGESRLCYGGHFGNSTGLSSSSCTGSCRSGYFCPPGSVSDTEHECGGVDRYCPPGSDSPSYVPDGFVSGPSYVNETIRSTIESCPLGFYCTGGESRPCPAGSFGNSTVLTSPSCSGLCPIGFYCPEGTSQPDSYPCPSGRYGSELGLFNSSCSGSCSPGFYCPLGSTNSTFIRCGDASVYCPEGSSSPVPVPDGWCSGPLSSSASTRSEVFFPDSYHICVNGT